jgi:dinuclear metal center YbgI/SA1388 family protein
MASAWDNAGLQVGDRTWEVRTVWVALDPLPHVVAAACEAQVDMLVTHHPLIFPPLKRVDAGTTVGAVVHKALQNRLAVYAAHTNLDTVDAGVNDTLAGRIGLQQVSPPTDGLEEDLQNFMRVGLLPEETTLIAFARDIKRVLGIETVRIAGDAERRVRKAAVCSGSGSSLLTAFFASQADVFLSGDIKYHDARAIENAGKALVDIGHFASEHLIVDAFAARLQQTMDDEDKRVRVEPYLLEKDPFQTV